MGLSPRLRPRLILTTDTDTDLVDTTEVLVTLDTDSDMDTDSDTAMDYCTARGLLMLRPRPILTFSTVDSDTLDTAMESMDMDTDSDTDTDSAMVSITASRLHQDLSVNQLGQKWIVIS